MARLEDDIVALMKKRVVDMAGTLGITITVELNGQEISFVKGTATIRGGTHVNYIADQVANYVKDIVNRKDKNANMKLHTVKGHLWVFVNARIDNPAFDSQTKETLITRQRNFGSICDLPYDFLNEVANSGVVSELLKVSKELKKTDGKKYSWHPYA
ncbi:hypothetical protein ACQ4PT_009782 [Festuca glaucescens]